MRCKVAVRDCSIAVVLALAASPPAHAGLLSPPDLALSIGVTDGASWSATQGELGFVDPELDNLWYSSNGHSEIDFDLSWALLVDPDPLIDGTFTVRNRSATSRSFLASVALTLNSPLAGTLAHRGIFESATLHDGILANPVTGQPGLAGDGVALLSDFAMSTYVIDGASVATDTLDFFLVPGEGACAGAACPAALSASAAALAPYAGPQPLIGMGARLAFTLSAGDSLTFRLGYEITAPPPMNAVPAPATLWLAVLALTGVAGHRRPRYVARRSQP